MPQKFNINSRTIVAPLAAFTMAGLLFVYARTSIRAAKRNAQMHRESDGGQINWHNEGLRQRGKLERPVDQATVGQLVGLAREREVKAGNAETLEERRIREEKGVRGKG